MAEPSKKALAWPLFDAIIERAPQRHVSPWKRDGSFQPDYDTLRRLLGVSLLLGANSASGVPALALDVWVGYELRRAGLDSDRVWPRARAPRVVSRDILRFVATLPERLREELFERLKDGKSGGTTGASATLLGKNYTKQVDVVVSAWETGPEVLISTKRMDYSFTNNAANRVEESYGDAKNLRLRYPQAACGFVFGLRSTAWDQSPKQGQTKIADRLVDLLVKMGLEPDAYHATALVVPEYAEPPSAKQAARTRKEAEVAAERAVKAAANARDAAEKAAEAAEAAEQAEGALEAAAKAEGDVQGPAESALAAQVRRSVEQEAKRAKRKAERAAKSAENRAARAAETAKAAKKAAERAEEAERAAEEAESAADFEADEALVEAEEQAEADAEAAGAGPAEEEPAVELPEEVLDAQLARLPDVRLRHDRVPEALDPGRFFSVMLDTLLSNTPVDYHREARYLKGAAKTPRRSVLGRPRARPSRLTKQPRKS